VRDEFYHLPPKERTPSLSILIFGGSQGSHFLNEGLVSSIPLLKKEKQNLRIFHQTGNRDFEWVKMSYAQNDFKEVTVSPFFFDMASYFQKSDLIISRSGATTIAELIAARKASLLVPFSKAADNHQLFNARELEKIRAAEVILEDEFTPQLLASKIFHFLNNKEEISQMEKNLASLRTDSAAEKISNLCFELMEPEGKA
jgi:UDP-N-acetylglucosamine--N-acetylmuramyl-(pentapeptide) pyrophosphoryl-undecaprenol N-acetylglucosamine transferase